MRRYAPAITLFIVAPLIAEMLLGATPISHVSRLLPLAAFYGSGAVIIREVVRRRGLGFARIVLLGVAFGMFEEGLLLQTFFNPTAYGVGDLLVYGRTLGVNWVWAEYLTGYHAVWSISIPILLTELLFPARRFQPWLGRVGLWIVGGIFVLLSISSATFFVFRSGEAGTYTPPLIPNLVTMILVLLLCYLGLRQPVHRATKEVLGRARRTPPRWLVGTFGFGAAALWCTGAWVLGTTPFPALGAMLIGLLIACSVVVVLHYWSATRQWNDGHWLVLTLGPLAITGSLGILSHLGNPIDVTGQVLVSVLVIVLLLNVARCSYTHTKHGRELT